VAAPAGYGGAGPAAIPIWPFVPTRPAARWPQPDIAALLVDLLGDLHPAVAREAACALGRMGRAEARPMLARRLREQPSAAVIQAIAAAEACIVLPGRIARTRPDLADDVLEALRDMENERTAVIVAAIERAARLG
jgi:HEAT repeat protein